MLELALKQERVKYHKLKFGTEPSDSKSTSTNVASNNIDMNGMNASYLDTCFNSRKIKQSTICPINLKSAFLSQVESYNFF
jgi:hypothetical protein